MLALFALTALTLPVELAVARLSAEPYPALFQPSFAGAPMRAGKVVTTEPSIDVRMADGSVRYPSTRDLLPANTGVHPNLVLSKNFSGGSARQDVQTRAWLSKRVRQLYPDSVARSITIAWHDISYAVSSGERQDLGISRSVTIDLGGTG